MFSTVIFDLDGTICHHKASYPKIFYEIFAEQFNKHSNIWLRHMMHNGEHSGIEAVHACFPNMSPSHQQQALKTFTDRWAACQTPYAGVFDAIVLLRSHYNCQIGVMTNGPSQFQWAVMNKLRVLDHVDFAYASGDAFPAECKPSVALLRKLEVRHNFSPETALFIGDNPQKDILPAREAGWQALHVSPHDKAADPLPLSTFQDAIASHAKLELNWSSLTL
ncbi:Phosphoglycolate phosphatase [Pseudovibrio axinellae]|uniref:phosphoglycolate phosphatase n=1 Tax=Pseudovibrio axinellae TaxID=989403 RepID=A0A166AMJ9_9HYPH|nr:HAD family hydrolase [Pseudovibrio axinellae]KZL21315.1 Phosphoglycolate phosphatase [Pseudovibrio axinellae]SEQ95814.1 FMN phosphatase YigB, HAD superfamily [Pseudovibrio axinellae]